MLMTKELSVSVAFFGTGHYYIYHLRGDEFGGDQS